MYLAQAEQWFCIFIFSIFSMNIFVASLDYAVQEEELRGAFEAFGEVSSVKIVTDRETGRSKGFGFVEMPVDEEGSQAIEALNGSTLHGRDLAVKEARPQSERSSGGGFRGGNRGGGGGYRGGDRDRNFDRRDRY